VTFTISVGQELTHANIPLDTVHNRNKAAQIHGLLGLQTFIITLYKLKVNKAETDINKPLPANNSNACHTQSLSLPKINLPTFSSDYTKWLSFKDLYVSLVHNNQELSDIKKLYYLKTCLKGDALSLYTRS
jgi:hypothetical protein